MKTRVATFTRAILLICGSWALSCTASVGSKGDDSGDSDISVDGAGGSATDDPIHLGDGDGDGIIIIGPDLGEETETPSTFRSPVVTGDYLWSPNPQSGKVALIHAQTLSTRVLSAGLEPTHLAAVPSDEANAAAIVINRGTSDASYFRVTGDKVSVLRIPLHVGANQWAISPSGRFAIAWSLGEVEGLDPTNGLQEISLIDLSEETPAARRLTVGFRPSLVTFDEDEQQLVVVSQLGISLVELAGTETKWVPLPQGEGRDVSITQDGGHALVRRTDESIVEILALDGSEERISIAFSGAVTDLDLSPSGRAVAVIRDQAQMATFVVEDVLEDPEAFDTVDLPGQIVGSSELTSDGQTAVLYTNAADSSQLSVVNLAEGQNYLSSTTLDTQTPIASVTVSPDGQHAVARAKGIEGSSAGAFTVLALAEQRFPRVLGTSAPIQHVDLGNEFGVVTASNASVHEAHLISLASLQVDVVPLASAPISAGVLPELGMGFAAQNHPEGRVTFFEFATTRARTLTGFELSSEAVQE